jgi:predicted nucleic acid-binding protein
MSAAPDAPLFFDTNILLYWLDAKNPAKQAAARTWLLSAWEQRRARLSWQVLKEFYASAVRKMGAPPREAGALAEVLAKLNPGQHSIGLMRRAWH